MPNVDSGRFRSIQGEAVAFAGLPRETAITQESVDTPENRAAMGRRATC